MANVAGMITNVVGEVFARSQDGKMRRLNIGDEVNEKEVIVTANGSSVEIVPANGPVLNIGEQQTVTLTPEVFNNTAQPSDGGVDPLSVAQAQTVIQPPTGNQDFNAQLEEDAAAAGLDGGSGGGSSFVDLAKIVEVVGGAGYEFPTNPTGTSPTINGDPGVPTEAPTQAPTEAPTQAPTQAPTESPTPAPTPEPTPAPTEQPPGEPTVVVTQEYKTDTTTDVKTETVVGNEYETGRNVTTSTTSEPQDGGLLKTTTVTTVIDYNQETNTITTTTTTTTTYVRDVTTTTAVDRTVTTDYSDWSVVDSKTTVDKTTDTTNTPRQETLTDVTTDFIPPSVEVTQEFRTEVTTDVKTDTKVGEEYETGRSSTTEVTTSAKDGGTLTTTTVTTVIDYNQVTDTYTTTTTTTTTYVRDVTTTTAYDGSKTVSYSDWSVYSSESTVDRTTDTVETPRQETLTDVSSVLVVQETKTEVSTDVQTQTVVGAEYETGRNTTTETTSEHKDGGTLTTTTTTTVIDYNQATDTITTTTTTTTTYVREITTTTDTSGAQTVVTGDWTVVDTNTDVGTTTDTVYTPRQETLTDVTTDFVADPPPPPPEVADGQWFIAQADNHDKQSTPDKSIDEGKGWDFNVVYQGNGNYTIGTGETVKIALDMWNPADTTAAGYGTDYNLNVTGVGQFVVTGFEVVNGQLLVTVAVDPKFNSANLTGSVFDVTVTAKTDSDKDAGELVGFDINNAVHTKADTSTVTVGSGWETNDDVLIGIVDTTQTTPVDPPVNPPPVDPPVSTTSENWFISHQGNKNFDQPVSLEEDAAETFNVQFQDREGSHIGVIHNGDTVDIKIKVTGDSLSLLDVLDVKPSNEFSAQWSINGDTLDVKLTNVSGNDANLQGNPFDVKFDVKSDGHTGTAASLNFDIDTVTVGGVWESNDQANYLINDAVVKGNANSNG